MESACRNNRDLFILAALYYCIYTGRFPRKLTYGECLDLFEERLELLEYSKEWSQGRHYGDCTNECNTCMRCVIEKYIKMAATTLNINLYGS